MDVSTRRVQMGGIANKPNGLRMGHIARNLTDAVDGFLSESAISFTIEIRCRNSTESVVLKRSPLPYQDHPKPPSWTKRMNSRSDFGVSLRGSDELTISIMASHPRCGTVPN